MDDKQFHCSQEWGAKQVIVQKNKRQETRNSPTIVATTYLNKHPLCICRIPVFFQDNCLQHYEWYQHLIKNQSHTIISSIKQLSNEIALLKGNFSAILIINLSITLRAGSKKLLMSNHAGFLWKEGCDSSSIIHPTPKYGLYPLYKPFYW